MTALCPDAVACADDCTLDRARSFIRVHKMMSSQHAWHHVLGRCNEASFMNTFDADCLLRAGERMAPSSLGPLLQPCVQTGDSLCSAASSHCMRHCHTAPPRASRWKRKGAAAPPTATASPTPAHRPNTRPCSAPTRAACATGSARRGAGCSTAAAGRRTCTGCRVGFCR